MIPPATVELARRLLAQFMATSVGRTNRQIDVEALLAGLGHTRRSGEAALQFLVLRGLINTFGPNVAFLTERGRTACERKIDLESLPLHSSASWPALGPVPPMPPVQSTPANQVRLTYIDLSGHEATLVIGERCTIGRHDDNDIHIDDKRASKRHAEIRREKDGWVLYDLSSANGTLLNGEYLLEPTPLRHEDEVVIGRAMIVFHAPEETITDAPKPPRAVVGVVEGRPIAGGVEALFAPGTDRPDPRGNLFTGGAHGAVEVRGPPEASGEWEPAPHDGALFDEGPPSPAAHGGVLDDHAATGDLWDEDTPIRAQRERLASVRSAPPKGPLTGLAAARIEAESLPVATPESAKAPPIGQDLDRLTTAKPPGAPAVPSEPTDPALASTLESPSRPSSSEFLDTLEAIANRASRSDHPDRHRLLEAMELLKTHPYVLASLALLERR